VTIPALWQTGAVGADGRGRGGRHRATHLSPEFEMPSDSQNPEPTPDTYLLPSNLSATSLIDTTLSAGSAATPSRKRSNSASSRCSLL